MKFSQKQLSLIFGLWLALVVAAVRSEDDLDGNDEVDLSTAQIAQLRKFVAEEHYVNTTDGYVLKLVRILNPLVNNGTSGVSGKEPLLLIHGISTAASLFVSNSINARPKDFTSLNVSEMSNEKLSKLLQDEPVSNSLAFLASCFGRDVWLLNRRGTSESLDSQKLNSDVSDNSSLKAFTPLKQSWNIIGDSFNTKYWNYSLDEQAKYDVPEVVDYVLNSTGSNKLDIVGHSAGGALILMALASQPDLARKLSHTLLWAPALYLGPGSTVTSLGSTLYGSYIGPDQPLFLLPFLRSLRVSVCRNALARRTICASDDDQNYGSGGHQQNLIPGVFNQIPSSKSSHEYAQLAQANNYGQMHTYDYESPGRNIAAYGQAEPILYDVAKIKSTTLSFWYGNTDSNVTPDNVEDLVRNLTVPAEAHFLEDNDLYFNHMSFFRHNNVSQLLIIPALKTIET